MLKEDAALRPIIYVRGYAMSQVEIDETTADPFCGFNLGSTVFRATPEKTRARKFIFESPVVRLASDFGYKDVFAEGLDIIDGEWTGKLPKKSIIIYRYYHPASNLLGSGETPKIEEFAKGLSKLIVRVRDLVCANEENETKPETFRCYWLPIPSSAWFAAHSYRTLSSIRPRREATWTNSSLMPHPTMGLTWEASTFPSG